MATDDTLDVCLVFMSPNGSTRKLSEMIASEMSSDWNTQFIDLAENHYSDESVQKRIDECDILGVGSPVYHLTMLKPVAEFLDCLNHIDGRMARFGFCFVTYGRVSTGKTVFQLSTGLHKKGYHVLGALKTPAPHFYEPDMFPEEDTIDYVKELVATIEHRIQEMVPWDDISKSLKFYSRRVSLLYPIVQVLGDYRVPALEFNPVLCRMCRRCEHVCPVDALDIEKLPIRSDDCLQCMLCAKSCPTGALRYDVEKWEQVLAFNKRRLSEVPESAVI